MNEGWYTRAGGYGLVVWLYGYLLIRVTRAFVAQVRAWWGPGDVYGLIKRYQAHI